MVMMANVMSAAVVIAMNVASKAEVYSGVVGVVVSRLAAATAPSHVVARTILNQTVTPCRNSACLHMICTRSRLAQ